MKQIFAILTAVCALSSCLNTGGDENDHPIARVYDKYLYASDLANITPSGVTDLDSLAVVRDYIDKWVKKELLLHKAEINLTEKEKDVEKQIEEYRTSLLIYKYEQNLIKDKLDTVITEEEIKKYFEGNPSNFLLNKNLVKALFVIVPRSAKEIWKIRKLYKADNIDNINELESYCYNNKGKYTLYEEWSNFEILRNELPKMYSSSENLLKYRKNIEVSDTNYYYFIKVYDYNLKGEISPLEYVEENIKNIILNKRKIQYVNSLEAEIYNDALNRGFFNIY